MRKLALALFTCIIICSVNTYSQNNYLPDSVKIGVSYKFVLYDDTEIVGKVTSRDSVYVNVKGEDGSYRLKKEDIFFISRNLTKNKFITILSLGGGTGFLNSGEGSSSYSNYKGQYSLQFSALFPLGENKGIRLDAGFSKWRKDEYVSTYSGGSSYSYNKEGERTKEFFSLKGDFVYGLIAPENKLWVYGTAGIGIHYVREGPYAYESGYYSTYDTNFYSYHYPEKNYTSAVLSIGCSVGYRFSERFGVYADAQLNTVTYQGFFLFFFGGGTYIPIRAGITYILF